MATELPVVLRVTARQSGDAQKILSQITQSATRLDTAVARANRNLSVIDGTLRVTSVSGSTAQGSFGKIEGSLEELNQTGKETVGILKGINDNLKSSKPAKPPITEEFLGGFVRAATVSALATGALRTFAAASVDLEAELFSFNTIVGFGGQELQTYGEKLRVLSLELKTNTGAVQNTQGAYEVASAGFTTAAQNAEVLSAVLRASTAGSLKETDQAARLIGGTLRAYQLEAGQASRVSDVLFTTVKNGLTTFPELAATVGNVTAVASQANISFEEINAALATTTSRGIKTATSVDGLRGLISNLIAPSAEATKELDRLGLKIDENSLKQKGLIKTLVEIARANGGSAESFKRILGDVQAFQVALALTGDEGQLFAK
ncbi:MAG TPA: phage tail tape measure protein, partial [Phycisphaerales bacterium]|nr:phage tail tape measure protein [Phycisphaerales bacterium]